jgi:hypothetical protein
MSEGGKRDLPQLLISVYPTLHGSLGYQLPETYTERLNTTLTRSPNHGYLLPQGTIMVA